MRRGEPSCKTFSDVKIFFLSLSDDFTAQELLAIYVGEQSN